MSAILKRPKVEQQEQEEDDDGGNSREEQEEALVALIEHRTREVNNLQTRVTYYTSKLGEAKDLLDDAKRKLARLRSKDKASLVNGTKRTEAGYQPSSPAHETEDPYLCTVPPKQKLFIPSANPKIFQASKSATSIDPSGGAALSRTPSKHATVKEESPSPDSKATGIQGSKRKYEPKEHKDLIPLVGRNSSPCIIRCHTSNQLPSQHKRKLRSLSLCPANDRLFATSALDGQINLWQIQAKGSGASLLSTTDCLSPQRKWPEDIAWHPQGNSIFCAYNADGGDSQIAILNLNKAHGSARVTFLENKPHVKGLINSISFMPWEDDCFVTGGSDHAVIMWNLKDDNNSWKPTALHRSMHSSAVMGVAGMQQKNVVLSAGADKRIFGYDIPTGKPTLKHQIESKCMNVLPNPCDFNLFMVQTGQLERQLRLFDSRTKKDVHTFGWKQESSESQSALIDQTWSPDGLYITSGSVDPVIHIFDIRYSGRMPSQSIRAHQKRVFKAVWHQNLPLLISISSDLNIAMHKII